MGRTSIPGVLRLRALRRSAQDDDFVEMQRRAVGLTSSHADSLARPFAARLKPCADTMTILPGELGSFVVKTFVAVSNPIPLQPQVNYGSEWVRPEQDPGETIRGFPSESIPAGTKQLIKPAICGGGRISCTEARGIYHARPHPGWYTTGWVPSRCIPSICESDESLRVSTGGPDSRETAQ
jgi:hypothetical protein